jgi:hypothetical protein
MDVFSVECVRVVGGFLKRSKSYDTVVLVV